MTAFSYPQRLLTAAEFVALPEDDRHRWELQEGVLVVTPSPTPDHNIAGAQLYMQVFAQLPPELVAVPDVDVDLGLVSSIEPATVRRPDLVVVARSELDRVRSEGGILRASEASIIVEIVSPGSRRTDMVTKRSEYAEAGIPHYWIIDLNRPLSLLAYRLTAELGYVDEGESTGTFRTSSPCPITVDLSRLA